MKNEVKVGVGVLIVRDECVLLGERIGSHGANTWSLPGGHLEFGETLFDCAQRETLEETGLTIESVIEMGFTNDFFKREDKHYITLFVKAEGIAGQPQVLEPEKCLHWKWFSFNELPSSLFLPLENFLEKYQFE